MFMYTTSLRNSPVPIHDDTCFGWRDVLVWLMSKWRCTSFPWWIPFTLVLSAMSWARSACSTSSCFFRTSRTKAFSYLFMWRQGLFLRLACEWLVSRKDGREHVKNWFLDCAFSRFETQSDWVCFVKTKKSLDWPPLFQKGEHSEFWVACYYATKFLGPLLLKGEHFEFRW